MLEVSPSHVLSDEYANTPGEALLNEAAVLL